MCSRLCCGVSVFVCVFCFILVLTGNNGEEKSSF